MQHAASGERGDPLYTGVLRARANSSNAPCLTRNGQAGDSSYSAGSLVLCRFAGILRRVARCSAKTPAQRGSNRHRGRLPCWYRGTSDRWARSQTPNEQTRVPRKALMWMIFELRAGRTNEEWNLRRSGARQCDPSSSQCASSSSCRGYASPLNKRKNMRLMGLRALRSVQRLTRRPTASSASKCAALIKPCREV